MRPPELPSSCFPARCVHREPVAWTLPCPESAWAAVGLIALLAVLVVPRAGSAAPPAAPEVLARFFGDAASATGAALAHGVCDVNGDGFADVIAGAWFWDKTGIAGNTGAAYVILGGPSVAGGDLSNPAAAGAIRIEAPPTANQFLGFSVGCAGDVNGDDVDDILIGDYVSEQIYVVFGATELGPIDLGSLGTAGYRIRLDDPEISWNFGYAVTGVGDLNDDGLDDVAVAAVVADTLGRTNNGRVYVLPGKQDAADVVLPTDPSASSAAALIVLDGSSSEERLGQIALAGAVDADRVPDFVVGSYTATPHGAGVAVPGAAWVISGLARGALDLATPGDLGFAVWGPTRGRDRLGIAVAGAGDHNGDGYADVLIGGDGVYNSATGRRTGSAWVVYGSAGIFAALDVVHTDASPQAALAVYSEEPPANPEDEPLKVGRGYWITAPVSHSGTSSESFGYALDGITDVNGDGVPDLLIGAYAHRTGDPVAPVNTGTVWVVYGRGGFATLDLGTASAADGYRIDGLASGDRFGRQVASVGDVDGNGMPDFAIGADFAARPLGDPAARAQAGEVTIALLHDPPGLPEPGDAIADGSEAYLTVTCAETLFECVGDLELIAASAYQVRARFALARGESLRVDFVPSAALEAALTQNGSVPGTLRLRATGASRTALDEEMPITISRPGWKRFGLPRLTPSTVTTTVLGKAPFTFVCPETYDRCKGEATLKIGGQASAPVRFALGSGASVVRKFALSPAVQAKLGRDGFLVGAVRVSGVVGGSTASAKTAVVVKELQ